MEDCYIKLWKIENSITDFSNILQEDKIYNFDKDTLCPKTLELEKYIYDIVKFHSNNKNISLNKNNHFIEYSLCKQSNVLNIEYNKKNKKFPLFSIICNTFDNTENDYFLFTDINIENYKYKEIPEENNLIICIPGRNTNIVFDGSKYYGLIKNSNNSYLKINVWEDTPVNNRNNTNNFDNTQVFDSNIFIENNKITCEKINSENIVEKILYENTDIAVNTFKTIIEKHNNSNIIIIKNRKNQNIDYELMHEKYGDLTEDIFPFLNNDIDIQDNNRFNRNKIVKSTLSKDVCYWIINESEKKKFEDSPFKNYNTYLNIEQIPSVLNYILFVTNIWFYEIKNRYSINTELYLNIKNIFITKQTKYQGENINKNIDDDFFTINIQLNDTNDYTGGEIVFENNDTISLEQGDMLIYNGKKLRSKENIKTGFKYTLVLMIDLC
jgi:hypothetical protein